MCCCGLSANQAGRQFRRPKSEQEGFRLIQHFVEDLNRATQEYRRLVLLDYERNQQRRRDNYEEYRGFEINSIKAATGALQQDERISKTQPELETLLNNAAPSSQDCLKYSLP